MSACTKADEWAKALQLMDDQKIRPNNITMNVAIGALGRGLVWEAAVEMVMMGMERRRLLPDEAAYSAAAHACARAEQWQTVIHLFDLASREGLAS
eukprot:CAMPEP_0206538726 /NCGR_PEP_ID=MMETSP0325_2-20121206/8042_1 /ASSEMBLY_ACC=CAM_ASM_000347 /TAXON_ID=2866 /ORGANISM="Crypthecodinium cohnii, Strain Seligo" /LENGTH=95 /DNA_ID=CAMNT_0054036235 /DNA_START=163 /DNA_END=447 /DNA_ORIENTATION=+